MWKTALFAQKVCKKCGFPHFLALILESAGTPLFVQINVFAVWALRLDRKYTTFGVEGLSSLALPENLQKSPQKTNAGITKENKPENP